MPTATNGSVSLYYQVDGSPTESEVVAFVPDAGLGGWSWGWQHAALAGPAATVVWDPRGTGRSDQPPGPYDLETMAADLETVLAAADVRRAHVVGAGLGGAVALTAARNSSRVQTLTLLGTGARGEDADLEPLFAPPTDRDAIRASLERTLSADFRSAQPEVVDGIVDWRVDGDADEAGWRAQVAALDEFDATDWGYEVSQPALVLHGTEDDLVPPDSGRELAATLPRGTFEPIPEAGHLAFVERSRVVNDRIVGFVEEHAAE